MTDSRFFWIASATDSSLTVRYCFRNSSKVRSDPVVCLYSSYTSVIVRSSPSAPFVTVNVFVDPSE